MKDKSTIWATSTSTLSSTNPLYLNKSRKNFITGGTFNPFPNQHSSGFYESAVLVFENQWGKEKLLVMIIFSFSHSVFYILPELPAISPNLKLSSGNSFNLE